MAIPFVITHIICCGALLLLLISSGYLLKLANEGRNKFLLTPSLIAVSAGIWLLYKHNRCCREKGQREAKDWIKTILLYGVIYLAFSWIFIVYLFVPWWIPGYQGGILLP